MRKLLALAGMAVLSACSGDDGTGDAGGDAFVKETGADAASDALVEDAGDASAEADVSVTAADYGSIDLTEFVSASNASSFSASAAFFDPGDGGAPPPPTCTTQVGSCCYYAPTDGGTTATTGAVSAGAITIKYGAKSIGTLTPSGTTYPTLQSSSTPSLMWLAGDTVDVIGAGDTIHAILGNVSTPVTFKNVYPTFNSFTSTPVSKSQNLVVTWNAATGAIRVTLLQSGSSGSIACTSATDTGTMTVDASLLAKFTSSGGTVELARTTSADASPDNAKVTLTSSAKTGGITQYQ